jgi:anti-sigma B factor antagonist
VSADQSSSYRPFAISVVRDRDEVAVVPVGELDLGTADKVGQAVGQVQAGGFARIVVDLRHVDFIDSTALRMLLSLRNDAKRNGYALMLVPPGPAARRIFELTGTRGLFEWRIDHAEPG